MEQEATPLISALGLQAEKSDCGQALYFSGTPFPNKKVSLAMPQKDKLHQVESVGTEVAYLLGYLAIQRFHPDLVINFGSCGAVAMDSEVLLQVGDVCYASGQSVYIDRTNIFPIYDRYAKGHYDLVLQPDHESLLQSLGIKAAKVGTRNSFSSDVTQLVDNNCQLVEMECASFAKICHRMEVPFMALKSISDFLDLSEDEKKERALKGNSHHDQSLQEQFLSNLDGISTKLGQKLLKFIQLVNA